jgi:cysteine desulfurase
MDYIYWDNNATTRLDNRVKSEMLKELNNYGNPSSLYQLGYLAKSELEKTKEIIASFINCDSEEIIFNSGASEGNNTILKNDYFQTIITSEIEHASVINTCKYLKKKGRKIIQVKNDNYGLIDIGNLQRLTKNNQGSLVSIIFANNEIGIIQDIKKISEIVHNNGCLLHVDAVQAFGKIPIDVKDLNIDYMTFTSHKIYGPKGIGAIYKKRNVPFENLIHGGDQENNLRAGTENTLGIIGFGKAVELRIKEHQNEHKNLNQLRGYLIRQIAKKIKNISFNIFLKNSLSGTISITFNGIRDNLGFVILLNYHKIMVSASSACHSNSHRSSHVLKAIGLSEEKANETIRISLGKYNTREEIDKAIPIIAECVEKFRKNKKE